MHDSSVTSSARRRLRSPHALTGLSAVLATGCLGASPEPSTTNFEIKVAPLTLPGVGDACYSVTVKNQESAIVWSRTSICADDFGDGIGAITYVGPCDASQPNHTVELTLDSLADVDGAPITDFQNPTLNGPIVLPALCQANADTLVTFNLVILRGANQGFFDIAVDFEDIFCSAKLDCAAGDLLYGSSATDRDPTAVLGFACTGGPNADTWLYTTNVQLVCDGVPIAIPLTGAPGNVYSASNPAPAPLSQVATYQGVEQLVDDSNNPLGKGYFNIAFALPPTTSTTDCTLALTATASGGPFDACTTALGTTYPVIQISAPDFITDGAFTCGTDPLNGTPNAGVWTTYTQTNAPVRFDIESHVTPTGLVVSPCPAGPSVGRVTGTLYYEAARYTPSEYHEGDPLFWDGFGGDCLLASSPGDWGICTDNFGFQPPSDITLWQNSNLEFWPSANLTINGSGGYSASTVVTSASPTYDFPNLPSGQTYTVTWTNPPYQGGMTTEGFGFNFPVWPAEPPIPLFPSTINPTVADWDGSPISWTGLALTPGATLVRDFGIAYRDGSFPLIQSGGVLTGSFLTIGSLSVTCDAAGSAPPDQFGNVTCNNPNGINVEATSPNLTAFPSPNYDYVPPTFFVIEVLEDLGGIPGGLIETALNDPNQGNSYSTELNVGTYCVSWLNPPPGATDLPPYATYSEANGNWSGVSWWPSDPAGPASGGSLFTSGFQWNGGRVTVCGVEIVADETTTRNFTVGYSD